MYATRLVTPLEPLRLGALTLKVYGLSVHQRVPDEALVDAALRLTRQQLQGESDVGPVGFVIVHEARPANFVLIHLWQGVDLQQWYFTSPLSQPSAFVPFQRGTVGCVWELGLMQHERQAWIRTVLSGASQAEYLQDLISGPI